MALIIFILWKVFKFYVHLQILQESKLCIDKKFICISLLASWDSLHANREERMRTTRTEPNFAAMTSHFFHDNYHESTSYKAQRYPFFRQHGTGSILVCTHDVVHSDHVDLK